MSACDRSDEDSICVPSNVTITSAADNPRDSAGESEVTETTAAPIAGLFSKTDTSRTETPKYGVGPTWTVPPDCPAST